MCEGLEVDAARYHLPGVPGGPGTPFEATVRVRYRHAGARATIAPLPGGRASVAFHASQRGVSPGQAAVFYDGDLVLGGGWISRTRPTAAGGETAGLPAAERA
jgi:tRNA U34 2-thiouridine synthase MnmA/TrmU